MMATGSQLQRLRSGKGISAQQLANTLGVNVERLRKWEQNDSNPRKEDAKKILEHFGISNLEQLVAIEELPEEIVANDVKESSIKYGDQRPSSGRVLNRKRDTSREPYTNRHGVRFEPLKNGQWLITCKHVPPAAHAAYTAGWGDPEYMESLPTRTTVVSELSEDNYLSMTVTGSCQDDGTIDGVPENMEVIGRSYTRSMWQYHLPFVPAGGEKKLPKVKMGDKDIELPTKNKRYRYWIVMDRHEGLQVVMIKSQDLEKGILHCACRNPDKKKHPDFDINLDDCSQLFFVTDRRIKE